MMKRREFITLLGGAAAAWPLAARAQRSARPLIGFVSGRSPDDAPRLAPPFRRGLSEAGFVDDQNVAIEYHWLDGHYERLPSLMADLVNRQVAVIAAAGTTPVAVAAKAATATIPIVFGVGEDPVRIGLVASLARPGANATGINFFTGAVVAKRLGLLHDMVPRGSRIAVLANPADASLSEATLRDIPEAARTLGLQIRVLDAATSREIEAVFETLEREPADALFVAPDAFYTSRRVQFAILAARYAIPTSFANRDCVEAGGLMSYGADVTDTYRQVGDYTGRILKGAKPADLPVIQSSKFELVINLAAAHALRLAVPGDLLSIADEVIE
jgi:putative tryptophan/tyrosine transport system substrate-binding protein